MLTRRFFLRGSAMVMAGVGRGSVLAGARGGGRQGKRKILVAIFQRGAADGLNIVVPFGEKRYYELRPTIGIPAPGGSTDQTAPPSISTATSGCIPRCSR